MNPINIFFACSCAILALAILNINLSPCINHSVQDWSSLNCEQIADNLEEMKSKYPYQYIEQYKKTITMCRILKAMYEMEYAIFTINLGIGVICVILGLYNIQKETISKTGIIGIAIGGIGFILTFIYVILNGIIFTNYFEDQNYKIDEDGSYAYLANDNYKCLYYTEDYDFWALVAKFSDIMKGRYNYDKEMSDAFSESNTEKKECLYENLIGNCLVNGGIIKGPKYYTDKTGERQICYKLYYYPNKQDFKNYDKSARILAVLFLSLFTALCYCGLAFSGFMLFKEAPK